MREIFVDACGLATFADSLDFAFDAIKLVGPWVSQPCVAPVPSDNGAPAFRPSGVAPTTNTAGGKKRS